MASSPGWKNAWKRFLVISCLVIDDGVGSVDAWSSCGRDTVRLPVLCTGSKRRRDVSTCQGNSGLRLFTSFHRQEYRSDDDEDYRREVAQAVLEIRKGSPSATIPPNGQACFHSDLEGEARSQVEHLENVLIRVGQTHRQLLELKNVQVHPPNGIGAQPSATTTTTTNGGGGNRAARLVMAEKRQTAAAKKRLEGQVQDLTQLARRCLAKLEAHAEIIMVSPGSPENTAGRRGDARTVVAERRKQILWRDLSRRLDVALLLLEATGPRDVSEPTAKTEIVSMTVGEEAATRAVETVLGIGHNLATRLRKEDAQFREWTDEASTQETQPRVAGVPVHSPVEGGGSVDDPTLFDVSNVAFAASASPRAADASDSETSTSGISGVHRTEAKTTAQAVAAAAVAKRYQQKLERQNFEKPTEIIEFSMPGNSIVSVLEGIDATRKATIAEDSFTVGIEEAFAITTHSLAAPHQIGKGSSVSDTLKIPTIHSEGIQELSTIVLAPPERNDTKSEAKLISIWSKLGIPSERPKSKNPRLELKVDLQSTGARNNALHSSKGQKVPVVLWSSLVKDLYTVPAIVVRTNATLEGNRGKTAG